MSKHLEQYDENGNRIDIYLNDDEVKVGNKTLAEKFDEIEEEIDGAGGYEPPQEGIPPSDLAGDIPKAKLSQGVQDSLGKADSAIQGVTVNNEPVTPDNNKKVNITVPTKTSDLNNDSDFVTQDDLPEGVSVDTQLADSGNPIANRAVNAAVNSLQTAINSLQSALDTLIGSGNVQGAIDTFNEVKAFLNGIDTSDPTLFNQLKSLSDAITALQNTLSQKANDNVVVKSISVNGQTPQTPTQGNVNINVQGIKGDDGITPYIGSNGHWWTGPETDSENDTGVAAQGPAGESITDADLTIGNALNGQGDVLGMAGAMQMKANVDSLFASLNRLYSKLGNMAFWSAQDKTDAAPTPLDWQVPQVTVTLDKTSLSANAMITNESDQEITGTTVSVDQGSGLTLKIKPRTGYAITAASATIGGVSQTLTENNGIYTLAIASVTSAITIVFSVTADAIPETFSISYQLTNCEHATGVTNPTTITEGSSTPTSIQLKCDSGYGLTLDDINVQNATKGTLTESGGVYTLTISNATDNVVITAAATMPKIKFIKGYYLEKTSNDIVPVLNNAEFHQSGNTANPNLAELCATSEYIEIPAPSEAASSLLFSVFYGIAVQNGREHTPIQWAVYSKETNGTFTFLGNRAWDASTSSKEDRGISASEHPNEAAAALAAYNNGTLYLRSTILMNNSKTLLKSSTVTAGYGIKVNGVFVFSPLSSDGAPTNYTLVDPQNWSLEDDLPLIDNSNDNSAE